MYIERSPHHHPSARVSVFVDGDNIPSRHAQAICDFAGAEGTPNFFRVYGNKNVDPGWHWVPGMRMICAGSGKNSADLLLTIEAMERALTGGFETVILATSDGDFRHLALYLKERGHRVIGVGYDKSPELFQAACTEFKEIKDIKPAPRVLEPLDMKIHQIIADDGNVGSGMRIAMFGAKMNTVHRISRSSIGEASWRGYLQKHLDLYDLDKQGPDARVRIRAFRVLPQGIPHHLTR